MIQLLQDVVLFSFLYLVFIIRQISPDYKPKLARIDDVTEDVAFGD